jgi:hypothetical protein
VSDERAKLVGLCAACEHGRRVTSAKQSTFVLCGLAATDPRFPKYPRLPVACCEGFGPASRADAPHGHQR